MTELRAISVEGMPEIEEGAPLGAMIATRAELEPGDVVVISQKIVSKAEGRLRKLSSITPGSEARKLAAVLGKEPALVQLVLDESNEVLRAERGILIVETHHGFVCANAGIDGSNIPDDDAVCLLPIDPDASARRIRGELKTIPVGVIVADSFGRAWRLGQSEVAIGCVGLRPLDDWRGKSDAYGQKLEATVIAVADEAAAAADLVRSKNSRVPAVVLRGLDRFVTAGDDLGARALLRRRNEDLFRRAN